MRMSNPNLALCFSGLLAVALFPLACASSDGGGGKGGNGSGGSGGSSSGGKSGSGGDSSGGKSGSGGSGGSGGKAGSGGSSGSGGSGGSAAGGSQSTGGSAKGGSGGDASGGSGGGQGGVDASISTDAPVDLGPPPVEYKLPPPDPCHRDEYIGWWDAAKQMCMGDNNSSMNCGGEAKCKVINACSQPTSPGVDVTFMCQRNLLFSPEMEQAAADDGMDGFHYAVVGHDPDQGGIDGTSGSCCQCYQLVYAYPGNDRQVLKNPDDPNNKESAIPLPPPLIVQSFNLGATTETFDVYMPAGGLGAHNACAPVAGSTSSSGQYLYTGYPPDGQTSEGGVKPATWSECRTKDKNWFTVDSFNQPACQKRLTDACNKITTDIPGLGEQSRSACMKANSLESFYHLNWAVYAARIECPENLTRVTGCKLQDQGLPKAMKDVKTATQAAANKSFWQKTGHGNYLYQTTTMEDCCRPSCASTANIAKLGLKPDPDYNVFYSCDIKGVPYTKAP